LKLCILTDDSDLGGYFSEYFSVYYAVEEIEKHDTVVLISYGKIISCEMLEKKLFLNVHNSLLPKYRGLHAFTWAIINGEKKLGYTLHVVNDVIDGGNILSQVGFVLSSSQNINDAFVIGNNLLKEWLVPTLQALTMSDIGSSKYKNNGDIIYVTKRNHEDNLIDWNTSSNDVHNFIRALTPPYTDGAYTFLKNDKIYIVETELLNYPNYIERPGKIVNISKNGLWVKTASNMILIKKIKLHNKIVDSIDLPVRVGNLFKQFDLS